MHRRLWAGRNVGRCPDKSALGRSCDDQVPDASAFFNEHQVGPDGVASAGEPLVDGTLLCVRTLLRVRDGGLAHPSARYPCIPRGVGGHRGKFEPSNGFTSRWISLGLVVIADRGRGSNPATAGSVPAG